MRFEIGVCPVCKTAQFRALADANAIRSQMEDLWQFHTRRLKAGAPVHQLFDRAIFSQAPPLHIVECTSCGTVVRNPRESEESIVDVYAGEEPPASALQDLFTAQIRFFEPRVRRLERVLGRRGSVLEVGSYLGAFLHSAQQRGWQAEGVDVNARANDFARAHDCIIHNGTIEEVDAGRRYDVVAFWNCLDQLPDPERALRHAHALLNEGGIMAARVPNGACYALLNNTRAGRRLLAHNNLLGFPYRHGFTPGSLKTLLQATGFELENTIGDTLISTAGPYTKGWAVLEERALKALIRLVTPASRAPWIEVYARVAYASAP
jgi:2-polyprenyl-3-methyl-5-hydroxy-6-metoxy-1,4-benzoquinol methylase